MTVSIRCSAFQRISGKLITPTWGVRAQVNGITQHLCLDDAYWEHNKTYVGGNIDAMINLSTLFAGAILTVSSKFTVSWDLKFL